MPESAVRVGQDHAVQNVGGGSAVCAVDEILLQYALNILCVPIWSSVSLDGTVEGRGSVAAGKVCPPTHKEYVVVDGSTLQVCIQGAAGENPVGSHTNCEHRLGDALVATR